MYFTVCAPNVAFWPFPSVYDFLNGMGLGAIVAKRVGQSLILKYHCWLLLLLLQLLEILSWNCR